MDIESVLSALQICGFTVSGDPNDPDHYEVTYQEGIFQFAVGVQEIKESGLTPADILRKMVRSLTSVESQESELSRILGTDIKIVDPAGWSPSIGYSADQSVRWPPFGYSTDQPIKWPPIRRKKVVAR